MTEWLEIPESVVRENGLPSTRMVFVSGWQMKGGVLGVWLAKDPESAGQRWAATNITPDELSLWRDAARDDE